MVKVVTFFMVFSAVVVCRGETNQVADMPEDHTNLVLVLEPVTTDVTNLQTCVCRLIGKNTGTTPLVVDKWFSLFVEIWIAADGKIVSPVQRELLTRPKRSDALKRFVVLRPGEKVERLVNLSSNQRVFHAFVPYEAPITGFEAMEFLDIPVNTTNIQVWVSIRPEMGSDVAFRDWFQEDIESVGLYRKRTISNILTFSKRSHGTRQTVEVDQH